MVARTARLINRSAARPIATRPIDTPWAFPNTCRAGATTRAPMPTSLKAAANRGRGTMTASRGDGSITTLRRTAPDAMS